MRHGLTLILIAGLALATAACDPATAGQSEPDRGQAVDAGEAIRPAPEAVHIDMGYTMGVEGAPIAVVEFSDFGCPYCARFARATFPTVRSEYVNPGTVRWRYVPVIFGFPGGELMGAAAVCAANQGGTSMFWRVHELLYNRQTALRGDDARPLLLDWISELGVDRDALDACIDAPATTETLQAHTRAAVEWYVRGTPSFVVNGVPMSGALPIEFFRRVFDTVLDPSGL